MEEVKIKEKRLHGLMDEKKLNTILNEWELHNQGGAQGYHARGICAVPTSKELVEENPAVCWNPSISGTKTEDAFIATRRGPLMITKPVVFPAIEYHKDGVLLTRPGMLILD